MMTLRGQRWPAEHVKHHLHFIAEAASHGCDLVVFPELSLTGPGGTTLPPP
ncbi:nitrilase-related carbon-nitrogen hydrolase, partial [Enterobacter intestinihominis]